MTNQSRDPREREALALLSRVGEGDSNDAFRQLVMLYGSAVQQFLQRRVGHEFARDLAQETFLRVFKNRDRFRGEASFKTWLLRIATNLAANHYRDLKAAKRAATTVSFDAGHSDPEVPSKVIEPQDEADDPSISVLKQEEASALRRAMKQLPERVRLCLQLRFFEECSIREIAEQQGVAESTVKSQLMDGKKRLRAELATGERSRIRGEADG